MKKKYVLLLLLYVTFSASASWACRGYPSPEKIESFMLQAEKDATLIFKGKITSVTTVLTSVNTPDEGFKQGDLAFGINDSLTNKLTFKISEVLKGDYDHTEITVYWASSSGKSQPIKTIDDFFSFYGREVVMGVMKTNADRENPTHGSYGTYGLYIMNDKIHPFSNDPDIENSYWTMQPPCFKAYIKTKE